MTKEQMKVLTKIKANRNEVYINNICFESKVLRPHTRYTDCDYWLKVGSMALINDINFINKICNEYTDVTVYNYFKRCKYEHHCGLFINDLYFNFENIRPIFIFGRLIQFEITDEYNNFLGVIEINRIYNLGF